MMNLNIHKGDIGTKITAIIKQDNVVQDISWATTKYFLIKQPNGTTTTMTAYFTTTGSDGSINFTSTTNTFDTQGVYFLQARLQNATNLYHTDQFNFKVDSNLE